MNARLLVAVAGLALLAGAGAWLLLSGADTPVRAPERAAAPAAGGAAPLPTFRDETPGAPRAPQALEARPAAGAQAERPPDAAATGSASPTRSISGRVVRASDGTPIGGVRVSNIATRIEPPEKDLAARTTGEAARSFATTGTMFIQQTAEDGHFQLDVPVDTPLLYFATSRASQMLELPPGPQDLRDVEVVFDSGFRVAGVVLDEGGAPLPGANVDVERQAEAVADEAGRFVVRDVVRSDDGSLIKVHARAPLHAQATGEVLAPRTPTGMPWVELRLSGSGKIEGTVSLADGAPAVGAPVEVALRMGTGTDNDLVSGMATSTDEHGAYAIDHVPAGRYLVQAGALPPAIKLEPQISFLGQVRLETPAQVQLAELLPEAWLPEVVVVTAQVTRLDITLSAGAELAGRVIDSSGAPVADAKLQLTRVARWPAPDINGSSITSSDDTVMTTRGGEGKGETTLHRKEAETRSDEHGRYAFAGLPGGEHLLVVSHAGGRLSPQDRTLVLRGDERLDGVDFVLPTGISLRSRVVDPSGRPLAGASVYLREKGSDTITSADLAAHSGEDGFFEVHGLQPGTMQISISLEGYGYLWEDVDTTAPRPSYVLVPSPKLTADITDAVTGEPVEAFAVQVEFTGSMMSTDTQPHAGGRFEYDVPGDERCKLTVTAPGYEPLAIEDILPSSTASAPVRFRLVVKP